MNHRVCYSHLEMSDLAEGAQEMDEAMEPTNALKTSSAPILHRKPRVKGPAAGEGKASHLCIELEGRDDMDAQDASPVTGEAKPAPDTQTVPQVSSNRVPTVSIMEDTAIMQDRYANPEFRFG
jgi:hypothetical protein